MKDKLLPTRPYGEPMDIPEQPEQPEPEEPEEPEEPPEEESEGSIAQHPKRKSKLHHVGADITQELYEKVKKQADLEYLPISKLIVRALLKRIRDSSDRYR